MQPGTDWSTELRNIDSTKPMHSVRCTRCSWVHRDAAAKLATATKREARQLNVTSGRRKQLGQLEINRGPLYGAGTFVRFEHAKRRAP